MRREKGITLVSLVVTIIVLIILAGVSINLTLGENGIITMAKRARENMELAKIDEERQMNELYDQIISEGGSSGNPSEDAIIRLAEFKRQIASTLTDMGVETADNADTTTMLSNIRSLTGASSADEVSYDTTSSGLSATNVQGAVDELNESLVRSLGYIKDSNVHIVGSYNGKNIYRKYINCGIMSHTANQVDKTIIDTSLTSNNYYIFDFKVFINGQRTTNCYWNPNEYSTFEAACVTNGLQLKHSSPWNTNYEVEVFIDYIEKD